MESRIECTREGSMCPVVPTSENHLTEGLSLTLNRKDSAIKKANKILLISYFYM